VPLFLRLLKFSPAFNCGGDIGRLSSFTAAAQQNNYRLAVSSIIHAVTWAKIQSQFKNAFVEGFGRSEISCFEAANVFIDARGSYGV
jgi:hypothetical protein